MALVLIEGFDHLTAAEVTAKGWTANPSSMQAGQFAGQCARCSFAALTKTLPSTYSTVIAGFAYRPDSSADINEFFTILTGAGSTILTLSLDTGTGGHLVVKNSGGTTIATGTTVISASTWYYIEVKLFVNGASGTVEVHLGGATEIASTTGNFGSTNAGQISLNKQSRGRSWDYDDIYVADTSGAAPRNTFLGDVRVQTIYPTGAGAHTAWTPDSGSNYARVNETLADGDTSYISDATPGDIDTYVFGDIDAAATVLAVQTNLYARKDDANTRQIAPVVRQSGTDYAGTTVTLTSSYVAYTQIYNQDPTVADWTASAVNANEFGVKEVA